MSLNHEADQVTDENELPARFLKTGTVYNYGRQELVDDDLLHQLALYDHFYKLEPQLPPDRRQLDSLLHLQLALSADRPKQVALDLEFAGWDRDRKVWVEYLIKTSGSVLHRTRAFLLSCAWRNRAGELVVFVIGADELVPAAETIVKSGALVCLHNAEVDVNTLRNHGVELTNYTDTAALSRWFNPSLKKFDLGTLYHVITGQTGKPIKFSDVMVYDEAYDYEVEVPLKKGTSWKKKTYRQKFMLSPTEVQRSEPTWQCLTAYAAKDAEMTLVVKEWLDTKASQPARARPPVTVQALVDANPKHRKAELEFVTGTMRSVVGMVQNGIGLDLDVVNGKVAQVEADLAKMHPEMQLISPINWNSSQQLIKFLKTLGVEKASPVCGGGDTKRGDFPTDEVAINWYLANYPQYRDVLGRILPYKRALNQLAKLNGYLRFQIDGRLHCSLGAGTVTGRLTLQKPQLNAIQSKAEKDPYKLRECFVANQPGYMLVVADYSQLEIVILAHVLKSMFPTAGSEFARLIQPGAEDLHTKNARFIFGELMRMDHPGGQAIATFPVDKKVWAADPFLNDLRDMVKTVFYGWLYGKEAFGFKSLVNPSTKLPIGVEGAEKLLSNFEQAMPALRLWREYVRSTQEKGNPDYIGYTWSMAGRIRDLRPVAGYDKFGNVNKWALADAKRKALNFPQQAGAADVVNAAMIDVTNDPELKRMGATLSLQVHDELVLSVPEIHVDAVAKRLASLMMNPSAIKLSVPLQVSVGHGVNYYEAK